MTNRRGVVGVPELALAVLLCMVAAASARAAEEEPGRLPDRLRNDSGTTFEAPRPLPLDVDTDSPARVTPELPRTIEYDGDNLHPRSVEEGQPVMPPSGGQLLVPDEVELLDAVEVAVIDDQVVAFHGAGGGRIRTELHLDEEVLWTGTRGRVGVAITDRRALVVRANSPAWHEVAFLIHEQPPAEVALGQQVAIFATDRRALAFHGANGNWVEAKFTPRERAAAVRAGAGTALVVTDRRALAISHQAGGFFEQDLDLGEDVESVTAGASVATITTSRRVLVFSGNTGSWSWHRRSLN